MSKRYIVCKYIYINLKLLVFYMSPKRVVTKKSTSNKIKPKTVGQALRIDGITPAAAYILLSHVKRRSIKHIA